MGGVKHLVVPAGSRVVVGQRGTHFQVSFEPLYGFQVVLRASFGQASHVELPRGAELLQSELEDLEVAEKLILKLGAPVDFDHGDHVAVEGVEQLAVDCAGAQVLDEG